MEALLDEFPGLKIIHLIRDPRATLMSQSRFSMCGEQHGGNNGCASLLCKRQEKDLLEEESISTRYPHRLKIFLYEDIAARPIETARKLFEFIGTTFTPKAKEYILNITSANKTDNCNICTTRSNSKEHINAWRKKITNEFRKIIEQRCSYILQRFYNSSYSANDQH